MLEQIERMRVYEDEAASGSRLKELRKQLDSNEKCTYTCVSHGCLCVISRVAI